MARSWSLFRDGSSRRLGADFYLSGLRPDSHSRIDRDLRLSALSGACPSSPGHPPGPYAAAETDLIPG